MLAAIPEEERAVDVKEMDLDHDPLPVEYWVCNGVCAIRCIQVQDRPLTRRGILSVVRSIYDPLGVLVPVVLKARLIVMPLTSM